MPASRTAPTRPGPGAAATATATAVMFAATGTLHFLRPGIFDPIVPLRLPGSSRSWTYGSGAAELVLAALVASHRFRNLGGLLAAVFLVAVFPANLRTVSIVRRQPLPVRVFVVARLPLQVPLIALALQVGRSGGASR
ncbi:hypothetical protein [Mycetocola sp.]|uniref:DoxX family protein n=1 Tax=Mycetocola sp. TaxID=1871042 RepID=UPI002637AD85|nr:hypothetical protein [Mycetocola sp.]